ncbi:MAG: hypothetical protein K5930_12215, partial [Treponemataceae bacterium]|nr:hypothetical protein [Treponemataceae bacterium]
MDDVLTQKNMSHKLGLVCEEGGRVVSSSGDKQEFRTGERCMLTAVPLDGYTFAGWTGDVDSGDKTICVTFDSDIFLSASFSRIPPEPVPEPEPEPGKYKLSIRCEAGGSVVSSAGDKTEFTAGERCMLTAVPEEGYVFDSWTGDVGSFDKTICVTLDSDIFLPASFSEIIPEPELVPVKYKLSVRCEDGGSVVSSAGDKTDFTAGERCMLTAVPEEGYVFDSWTGDVGSFDKTICVTLDSDIFLSASFSEIIPEPELVPGKYKLSIRCEDGGSVVSSAGDKTEFTAGERCMLTALPADGYTFSGWTGDVVSFDKNICVTLDSDVFLSASFDKIPPAPVPEPEPEPVKYKLSVRCEDGGSVVSSAGDKTEFTAGERCMLTAVPADGYTFSGWTGDVTSSEKNICVTLVSDVFLSASFDKIPPAPAPDPEPEPVKYKLSVRCESGGSVVSSAGDKTDFLSGERCMLTALPADGYTFGGWTGDVTSSEKNICVTFDSDIFLSASFDKIPPAPAPEPEPEPVKYKLSVRCEPGGVSIRSPGATPEFTAGERCMLTALPADGYTFGGWTGDVGSFDKTICVTFDSDIFLSASFDKIPPAPAPDPEPEPVKYKLS